MSKQDKLARYIEQELRGLQDKGYFVPDNGDMEVGVAIQATARNIAVHTLNILKADEYVLLEGKFYAKKAIQQIAAHKKV